MTTPKLCVIHGKTRHLFTDGVLGEFSFVQKVPERTGGHVLGDKDQLERKIDKTWKVAEKRHGDWWPDVQEKGDAKMGRETVRRGRWGRK